MRTTLTIDDDVLSVAKELADSQRKSVGEVISALARIGLTPRGAVAGTRNGFPLLKSRNTGVPITSELVRQLDEQNP